MLLSGFPEPYLSGDVREYRRWRSSHLDIILRQDLLETETIKSIHSLELLVELMTERTGSLVSYNSLREDLNTDDKTVKRWFDALENSYVFFKVTPYSKKISRAIRKSPKYYFFDVPRVQNEVDFLICHEKKPLMMIETKLSDNNLENSFHIFEKSLGAIPKLILVKNLDRNFSQKTGARVTLASEWLAKMDF